ncbi:MAG: NAD-dependent epimerase/dehydratase family protein [Gallionellaceae bacterium]|jgi:nucleoside-diphosphate-sugar epimerase
MAQSALVTGASGFVGTCLVKHLLAQGWHVHLIARQNSNLDAITDNSNSITVHRIDGSYQSIESVIQQSNPDLVFHLASLFLAQHQPNDVSNLIESNLLFPALLLEAMFRCGKRNLINTGTSWQHYQNQDYCPVNLYAATKDAFERLITFYVDAHGFKVKTLKLFDTYGPGDKRKKLFYLLRQAAQSGDTLKMSPGEQKINLVYGEDVAKAFLLAGNQLLAQSAIKHDIYGVAHTHSLSLRELVDVYSQTTGFSINVNWGALPYRPREVMTPWTNYTTVPEWAPSTDLNDGITRMESDASIQGLLRMS